MARSSAARWSCDADEALLARRVLAKDAHGQTIRLAPPLVIDPHDLRWGLEQLTTVATDLYGRGKPPITVGAAGR